VEFLDSLLFVFSAGFIGSLIEIRFGVFLLGGMDF